jgi:hypothetical protein
MNDSSGQVAADNREQKFAPFFERMTQKVSADIITSRLIVSVLIGLPFLALHYYLPSLGEKGSGDWSWFLGLLITMAMLCVYYATYTLENVFRGMNARLGQAEQMDVSLLRRALSDAKFAWSGVVFGLLNCGVGLLLGLPYNHLGARVAILSGYFLAGFVCGVAVLGICGIFSPIRTFSGKASASFDFTSPDHCAGTGFIGDALIVFSSVTLLVGVMISIYVFETKWQRNGLWWVAFIKGLWIAFPYFCSIFALLTPAVPINEALREYKMKEDIDLKVRVANAREELEKQAEPDKRKNLREDYEFLQNRRKDLHAMRTWPFGLGANLKYASILVGSIVAHICSGAAGWLGTSLGIVSSKQ